MTDNIPHGGSGGMASTITLSPPPSFDFKQPDEWTKWKRRFEQFMSASGLDKEDDARKISTFLYCIGDEAEDILVSTNITDESRKKYADVMAKFDAYFQVRKNVRFERAKFNRRDQREGESAEEYITELYALSETCEFKDRRDEMLLGRLIVGIRDKGLSEKLQFDTDLTLEKAKKTIRQKEAVREQSHQLSGKPPAPLMEDVTQRAPRRHYRPQHGRGGANAQARGAPGPDKCTRCGRRKHQGAEKCPARNATCYNCKKKGHLKAYCFSKPSTVSEVAAGGHPEDQAFLETVSTPDSSTWRSTLLVNGKQVQFKLDTGISRARADLPSSLGKAIATPN